MSKKWQAVIVLSFGSSMVAAVIGFAVPRLLDFTLNILAEIFGTGLALGLAVLLIEGRLRTQEARRQKIVARLAKSVLQMNNEIGIMLSREIGEFVTSALRSSVDLYGPERGGDWDRDFKPLLLKAFEETEAVAEQNRVPFPNALELETYKIYLSSAESYIKRVREGLDASLEVHERLLELDDKAGELRKYLTQAMWPSTLRSEAQRFGIMGKLGKAVIGMVEMGGRIYKRL